MIEYHLCLISFKPILSIESEHIFLEVIFWSVLLSSLSTYSYEDTFQESYELLQSQHLHQWIFDIFVLTTLRKMVFQKINAIAANFNFIRKKMYIGMLRRHVLPMPSSLSPHRTERWKWKGHDLLELKTKQNKKVDAHPLWLSNKGCSNELQSTLILHCISLCSGPGRIWSVESNMVMMFT